MDTLERNEPTGMKVIIFHIFNNVSLCFNPHVQSYLANEILL